MKTAVCIVVILSSVIIGSSLRGGLKRRCESLEGLRNICISLCNEISFRMPPLGELIVKHSQSGVCASLFAAVGRDMSMGFTEAWHINAHNWSKSMNLTDEESETVQLLSSLGSSDVEGERHLLNTVSERLSQHSLAARTELVQKGKMLFSCPILTGLAIVIFII